MILIIITIMTFTYKALLAFDISKDRYVYIQGKRPAAHETSEIFYNIKNNHWKLSSSYKILKCCSFSFLSF